MSILFCTLFLFCVPIDCKFVFHSVKSTFNPACVKDLQISVFNNSDGISSYKSSYNMSTVVKVDFQKIIVTFEVKVFKDPGVGTVLFQGNIDSCNVAKGTVGNFLIKALLDDYEKHSNHRFGCPQKKGFYYWYDFPIPDDSALPPFIPKYYVAWDIIVKCKGKNAKSGFVPMFLVTFSGETVRD